MHIKSHGTTEFHSVEIEKKSGKKIILAPNSFENDGEFLAFMKLLDQRLLEFNEGREGHLD